MIGIGRVIFVVVGIVCGLALNTDDVFAGDLPAAAHREVTATSDLVPLHVYGGEPRIDMITLSPSGERIARVEAVDGLRALVVSRLNDMTVLAGVPIGRAKVRALSFIDEDRVLVMTSQTESLAELGVGRFEMSVGHIVDVKTRKVALVLGQTEGVMASPYGGIQVHHTAAGPLVLTLGQDVLQGEINLYRIDLSNGRGRSVRRMSMEVESFVADADGTVVAVSEYLERTGKWTLKLLQNGNLREVWRTVALLDQPRLIGLGRTADTVLVSAQRPDLAISSDVSEDGFQLFEVSLNNGAWQRLDVQDYPRGLVYSPFTQLLIGVAHREDMGMRYSFFDDVAAQRWRAIERAFPDQYPIPASWSRDMGAMLVFINRADSGHYQLVDFKTGQGRIAGELFPDLPPSKVGELRHLTYAARDGLEIPAYMTLPPGVSEPSGLPLVVLPHGGPAAYDEGGYDYWAQALASRGYAVLQPNFRGSTGYGRDFLEAGYGQWGRKMQTDLSDGVQHLAKMGLIDPARVCIMGGSYGGYAAMAGLALEEDVYRCAVSINGVSDLRRMLNWTASRLGTRPDASVRYWSRFMGAEGVRDRALDAFSPAMQVERVTAPLLLVHGKDDTVVPIEQSRVMASAMREAGKTVELIELSGEDHWLSQSETRTRMLQEAVRFLEAHNPPR